MKQNKREQKRKRIAAITAIIIVIAMVISLITPIFSARAETIKAAKPQATVVVTNKASNNASKETDDVTNQKEVNVNDFSSNVFIGFEQQYIVGSTVPISAILVNNSSDFKGEFQLKVYSYIGSANEDKQYSIYYQPLELPKGAGKQINMTVPMSTLQKEFELTLLDEQNNVVYRKNINAKALDPATMLVGVLSERPTDLAYLSAIRFAEKEDYTGDYTKTVFLTNETFPNTTAVLNSFKVIVIDDFDTKVLSEEQKNALLEWIEQGGICVIGTGVNAEKTLNGLQNIVTTSNYDMAYRRITLAGTRIMADVAEFDIENENIETIENGFVLHMGSGAAVIYDISLSLSPATETAGFINDIRDCCENLSSDLQEIKYRDSYDYNRYNSLSYVAKRFPEWERGPIYIIMIIIAIYVVVIGPVIYFVLKMKDKREKGWIVIPATSVIFMMIVFVLSINSHNKSGILNVVSNTKIEKGQSMGKTEIFVSAKTSKKGNVTLAANEFMDLSVPSEDRWSYSENAKDICMNKIRTGDKTEIVYLDNESWQSNNFELETTTNLGGVIDCDIKMQNDKVIGSITNHTNRNFKEIFVMAGQKIFLIENLKEGETYTVDENIVDEKMTELSQYNTRAFLQLFRGMFDREELNKQIKEGKLTRQDAYRIFREREMIDDNMDFYDSTYSMDESGIRVALYAFDEEGILPQQFTINGQTTLENTLNLYVMEDVIRLSETESFDIPFGILRGKAQGEDNKQDLDKGIDYYNDHLYTSKNAEVIWEFSLPEDTTIESFQFRSLNDVGNYYQAPEIYNAQTEQWELLKSDEYNDASDYITVSSDTVNNCIMVKYFVQRETEVSYPDIKLKGAGQNVGN